MGRRDNGSGIWTRGERVWPYFLSQPGNRMLRGCKRSERISLCVRKGLRKVRGRPEQALSPMPDASSTATTTLRDAYGFNPLGLGSSIWLPNSLDARRGMGVAVRHATPPVAVYRQYALQIRFSWLDGVCQDRSGTALRGPHPGGGAGAAPPPPNLPPARC